MHIGSRSCLTVVGLVGIPSGLTAILTEQTAATFASGYLPPILSCIP